MKKLLYAVLALILLFAGAIFIIPAVLDVNQYKPVIEAQFKAATGYELSMKGPLKLSLFPRPKLSVADVTLFNNSKSFANIEQISTYPKLKALLHQKFEIDSVKLNKPVMSLLRNEGGDNWVNAGGDPKTKVDNAKLNINITDIELVDGKIQYEDKVKEKTYEWTDINVKTGIPSLAGPVSFDGSIKYKTLPIVLKGKWYFSDVQKVAGTATILGSDIFYDGSEHFGSFSIKSNDIGPLADAFDLDEVKQLAKLPINAKGDIAMAKNKFDLDNMEFTIGETRGEGDLSMALDSRIEANADLKFESLNLDQLVPKQVKKTSDDKKDDKDNDTDEQREISADLDITANTVTYGGVAYKNLDIKASTEDNVVTLQPLKFDFPKTGSTEIFGVLSRDTSGRVFEGHITSNSENLRDILKSLKINLDAVKPEMLGHFNLDSELVVNIRDIISVELSKTALQVDKNNFSGNISTDFGKVPNVDINGTINALDLDSYIIPDKPDSAAMEKQKETGATDDKPFRIVWLEELPVGGGVNILIGNLGYYKDNYSNFRLNANFKPGVLNVTELTAAGKKFQIAAAGDVLAFPNKKPKIDIHANLGKINLADFIKEDDADKDKKLPDDKTRWQKKTYNLSMFRRLNMDFDGKISSIIHDHLIIDDIDVKGYIENGRLVIEKSASTLYGGKLALNGYVEATAVPSFNFAYSANNSEIGKLVEALTGNNTISGKASFSGQLSSSGVYQLAMISNLAGTFTIASNNLVVRGFDVDGMSGQIINTNNIADVTNIARTVAGDDAVTYLKSVSGGITFEGGMGRTQAQGIVMQAAAGPGVFTGKGDVLNWNLDSNAKFKLNTPDGKTPSAIIHIFGPLDAPRKELNLDEVKRYISGRGAKQLLNGSEMDKPAAATPTPAGATTLTPDNTQPLTKAEARLQAMRQRQAERQAISAAKKSGWQQPVMK